MVIKAILKHIYKDTQVSLFLLSSAEKYGFSLV